MLVKIGDAYVDPEQIAAIRNHDGALWIQLRSGKGIYIDCDEGELLLALTEAGVYDPSAPCADCAVELPDMDTAAELRRLYEQGFRVLYRWAPDRINAALRRTQLIDGTPYYVGGTATDLPVSALPLRMEYVEIAGLLGIEEDCDDY